MIVLNYMVRTMGNYIPLSAILHSTTSLVRLYQYLANVFSQLGVKLQQNDRLNLGQHGLKNYR